jgi:hypothetical protein
MRKLLLAVLFIMSFVMPLNLLAQIGIDIEGGLAISGYNDARIPGDDGTLFSFSEELKSDDEFYYRLRLYYTLADRHSFSILYAPLSINATGNLDKDVKFRDLVFSPNENIEGTYTFNSYRFTYRYKVYKGESFEFGIGLTAKIRDAEIGLKSETQETVKDDFGFVPLINFRAFLKLNEKFGLLLSGDALAAPQGRAEDVLIAVTYNQSENFRVKIGYRILEGGADNDEVYTFSFINYAALGIELQF